MELRILGFIGKGIKFILFDKPQIIIYYLMYVQFVCSLESIGSRNQFLLVPKWSNKVAPTVVTLVSIKNIDFKAMEPDFKPSCYYN